MKISSIGLEVECYLTKEETLSLRNSRIEGMLKFIEVDDNKCRRKIPTTLILEEAQREFLEVRIIPSHTYFGDAEKIDFRINEEFYNHLLNSGSFGDRFLGSGKLLVYVTQNIKIYNHIFSS